MSRIGKQPVVVPQGVEVKLSGGEISIKGKLGTMTRTLHNQMEVVQEGSELLVKPRHGGKKTSALWGLTRALLANMVTGVTEGFSKSMEVRGVGYRAAVQGRIMNLSLGYSHPVNYALPDGISAVVDKNTLITVTGMDKQQVGQTCAEIRSYRKPEPYKGKGVRYVGEFVVMKEGKKK